MNRKLLLILLPLMMLLAACSKEEPLEEAKADKENKALLSRAEINDFIVKQLELGQIFRWETASNELLWSAAIQSDSVMAIGFQPVGFENIQEKMHLVDISAPDWKSVKERLINFIVRETNAAHPDQHYTASDLMVLGEENILPVIDIQIFDLHLIEQLRAMPEVRYIEPMGYTLDEVRERSGSGCDVTPDNNIPSADFQTISPNVKVPWNFYNANIPSAWNRSTGAGVTVAVIDTGTDSDQENVGSAFNSGQSQGRYIQRLGTYVSSWWWWASPDGPNDRCGHGTQMSGLATAPRGNDGASVGVAYNANLLAIRACADVVILGSNENRGVADAVVIAGGRGDVKVLSMSIGTIFWVNQIADAIYYAYGNDKMIMAAAGTSTSFTSFVGVIFPASMSQTVAVTGIKEGSPMVKCSSCHSGSQVDFVAVMQRRNDNSRTSLTLAEDGNVPARVGGSSAATATTAGIAALVWATNPSMSRNQVMNKLKNASSNYPSRNSQFGWGTVDAGAAVN